MKIHDTRKQKAAVILERLQRGPSFSSHHPNGNTLTVSEAEEQFRRWSMSWILGDLQLLIPELRKKTEA